MPGHNVGKSEGPDPDPLPWLAVSEELKAKLMTKPYDAKKSTWVPDKSTGGYLEGLVQSKEGDKATVKLIDSGEVNIIRSLKSALNLSLLFLPDFNRFLSMGCRRKSTKQINWTKSILPSLMPVLTWLI